MIMSVQVKKVNYIKLRPYSVVIIEFIFLFAVEIESAIYKSLKSKSIVSF